MSPLIGMPIEVRVYVHKYLCYPDMNDERDKARLADINSTLDAIVDAGLHIVESDDGR